MNGDERVRLETEKLKAEIRKLNAEAAKTERERTLYPVVLLTAAAVAFGTVIGAALRFLG